MVPTVRSLASWNFLSLALVVPLKGVHLPRFLHGSPLDHEEDRQAHLGFLFPGPHTPGSISSSSSLHHASAVSSDGTVSPAEPACPAWPEQHRGGKGTVRSQLGASSFPLRLPIDSIPLMNPTEHVSVSHRKPGSLELWLCPQDLKDPDKQLFLHSGGALAPGPHPSHLLTHHASSLLVPTLSSLLPLCALVAAQ